MATKTITQFGTISGVAAGDELLIWDTSTSLTRKVAYSALAAAVLTAPTITDFTNATHTHQTNAQGGKLDHGAALNGLSDDDHTQYLLATGSRAGATSQAQAFTNGVRANTIDTASGDVTITPASGILALYGTDINMISDSNTRQSLYTYSDSGFAQFQLYRAKGSQASPSAVSSGISLGALTFRGYHSGNAFHNTGSVDIRAVSTEAFTSTARGGELRIYTTATGTTTLAQIAVFSNAGALGVGVTSPVALLDLAASTTTRASARIAAGSRPTTPNTGDLWDDGALVNYHKNATTAAVDNLLKLEHSSSGTPAAGFGIGVLAQLQSSTTETQSAGRLTWHWADATHASRAAVGRLTAYYTSTERAVIVWTATSSSATVAISGTLSVSEKLRASATGESIAVGSSNTSTYVNIAGTRSYFGYDGNNVVVQGGANKGVKLLVNNATFGSGSGAYLNTAGQLGIGITPAALLHGHDGSGGFLFINRTSIGGTAVTVIANGTGDVTQRVAYFGWVENSAGFSQSLSGNRANGASGVVTDGTNDLTIAVAANGTFTLQATAGAATWTVVAMAVWR